MLEITTARLTLKPVDRGDLVDLWKLWTDAEVRRFLWDGEVITLERAADVLEESLKSAAETGLGLWAIKIEGWTSLAGFCSLRAGSTPAEAEPLIALAPKFSQQGYAAEALGALIRYAFDDLRLTRLIATVDEPNMASRRLLERLGFNVAGGQPGVKFPLLCYALSSEHRSEHHT